MESWCFVLGQPAFIFLVEGIRLSTLFQPSHFSFEIYKSRSRLTCFSSSSSTSLRERTAILQADNTTLRASRNTATTSPNICPQFGAQEGHVAQTDTGESESATIFLPMQALKGEDSSGNLVILESAELGAELRHECHAENGGHVGKWRRNLSELYLELFGSLSTVSTHLGISRTIAVALWLSASACCR